jgi:hypothetical protein
MVPVSSSIANINATGTYIVTSSANETVLAITTSPTATLDLITIGNPAVFTALAGTGTGVNAGTITVDGGSRFVVGGTVKDTGTISLIGGGYPILGIKRDTILESGGKVTLSATTGQSQIADFSGLGATLTNVDNVISGSGIVNVALVNESKGVIDANAGNLQVGGGGYPVTNAGLLEATSAGYLFLTGQITNTASGVIGAFGAGSTVVLNGTVSGGTLETGSGGEILANGAFLDGSNSHTVTNTGSVVVANGLALLGTISNTGTIALNNHITVEAGGATLAGSGNFILSDSTGNSILGFGANATLTNQSTISGAGTIGGEVFDPGVTGALLLNNQGVIDATGTNPLIVDTGASAVTNSGTLEATNNATLFVASNVTNTGHLIANNGTEIFAGAVSGNGTATVQGAGSIEFGSTTTSNITFAPGADGKVTFDAASSLTGKLSITGFALGDTIDLADIKYGGSGPSLAFSKGVLTVSDGTDVAKLNMVGNFTLASFKAAPDGSGGTLITDPPLVGSAPTTSPPGLDHVVALFTQSAAGFSDQSQQGVLNTNPLSQVVTNQEQFLANPHHG